MMIPFLSRSSGGSHLIMTDVEESTSITTLTGFPAGAAKIAQIVTRQEFYSGELNLTSFRHFLKNRSTE